MFGKSALASAVTRPPLRNQPFCSGLTASALSITLKSAKTAVSAALHGRLGRTSTDLAAMADPMLAAAAVAVETPVCRCEQGLWPHQKYFARLALERYQLGGRT
jgi:hypothetical protein